MVVDFKSVMMQSNMAIEFMDMLMLALRIIANAGVVMSQKVDSLKITLGLVGAAIDVTNKTGGIVVVLEP